MSPEQVLGQGCDARTDIYAAGVLLFLLLSGRTPFHHHRTEVAILSAHVTEPPPALSSVVPSPIPAGLGAAVARALEKDPADRFASVEELGRALSEPHDDARRRLRALAGFTAKMPGNPWKGSGGTAPLDAAAFRPTRNALPFKKAAPENPASPLPPPSPAHDPNPSLVSAARASNAASTASAAPSTAPPAPRLAPSFGLPPAPKPSSSAAATAAAPTGLSLADALQGNRLLLAAVIAIWCLVAVMIWRVL
jgi:serine/threonine-protein kinase